MEFVRFVGENRYLRLQFRFLAEFQKMSSSIVEKPDSETVRSSSNDVISDEVQPSTEETSIHETIDYGFSGRFAVFAAIPSWLTSMILHIMALLILTLLVVPKTEKIPDRILTLAESEQIEFAEELPVFELEQPDLIDEQMEVVHDASFIQPETERVAEEAIVTEANELNAAAIQQEVSPLGLNFAMANEVIQTDGGVSGSGIEGRGAATKTRLLREAGGTAESERAVQLALQWLANHQNQDGSWNFRHSFGKCACPNHGSHVEAVNGATAMALLPFLGAGHTHMEGKYKENVLRGLYFLRSHQKTSGSFLEKRGNMYSHGLAAITLTEAYAMTQDPDLMRPAQAALNYTAFAQDPIGGGWRYFPQQPGDTSAVGWQLMALKSGKMAYLNVNPMVLAGANKFLDFVQTDEGSSYGYLAPGDRIGTTAIGLLCRMYMGWTKDNPALVRGVKRLSKSGPSKLDMYYNYYATQVMRHYEGPMWDKWNEKMRDFLIEKQAKKGHMAGSWHFGNGHAAKAGGRLYNTCLSTMVLEVYYRHMPIYRQQATEDTFEF